MSDKQRAEFERWFKENHTQNVQKINGEHYDMVNKPKRYDFAPGIEAIDVIEATLTTEQFKGFLIGNALKYRLRAGDKGDALQDIEKAKWYQDRARKL